jgi:hypothetical protein
VSRASILIFVAGALVVLISGLWWWLTYSDVIRYEYISVREAGVCLVGESTICHLARALCRGVHPVAIVAYSAAAFWLGVATLSAGLIRVGWAGESTPRGLR